MTIEDRIMAATLRRCKGQFARPTGVSHAEVDTAKNRGFLKFNEWPSGHFEITNAGKNFLADLAE